MDNASRAWELPKPKMRTAALALLVTIALLAFGPARTAHAQSATGAARPSGGARAALADASSALSADPPKIEVARAALSRATAANDDPDAVAEAYYLLGKLDEDQGAYPQALADDRAAVSAAPNTRWALRASDRIDWLRARSEGDFVPLSRLERIRHDPSLASDPATIDALARDADTFPPGMVRVEARMLIAEAWLGRLHRPDDAIGVLRKVVGDPKADPLTSRLAERELVDALVASGRIDEAVAEATAHTNRLDPRFVRQVKRLLRRRAVRHGAVAVLALFGALAVASFVRAQRRGVLVEAGRALRSLAPVAALFVAFVVVAGGLLASSYESGNAAPFVWLGAAVLPLVLVARAWSAVGAPGVAARTARALLCGATVVATAFVLLDALNPAYLEGFGL
jgi:hypothetical protein